MIKIENVSMKFNLEIEKDFSMKQAFVNLFTKRRKRKNEDFGRLKTFLLTLEKEKLLALLVVMVLENQHY